jgi:endonuclease/exonuclease/phosphatase family metal-dependent hydrolase
MWIVPSGNGAGKAAALTVALALVGLGACTSDTPTVEATSSGTSVSSSATAGGATQLHVMTFNVEYGGEGVDFSSVPAAIEAAGADVVGVEEAFGNTEKIAGALGWPYYDPRLQIVSRLPLLDPPDGGGVYTFVEVAPGRVVAIANVHLPSAPYGPNMIRDGAKAAEVMRREEHRRIPVITPIVDTLKPLIAAGIPAFITGDFNTPSHLDWTAETVGLRPQVHYAFDWPVGEVVEAAGFRDSFRDIYPDPVTDPGITWPAARPKSGGYNPGLNDNAARDRIDFVYAAGPATATDSVIWGEEGGQDEGVMQTITPWPSDHRAVVSTFDVQPGVPPVMVTTASRLFHTGDDVPVAFHAPGEDGEQVAVVRAGEDVGAALDAQPTGDGGPIDGAVTFASESWKAGAYEAVLASGDGTELARYPFWIQDAGVDAQISTGRPTYREGEPIDVSWQAAPGNRWDWVGIYKRGADPNVAWYLLWLYTNATIEGSTVLDADSHGAWPLKPGKYSVYLLIDDSYVKVAGANFAITG